MSDHIVPGSGGRELSGWCNSLELNTDINPVCRGWSHDTNFIATTQEAYVGIRGASLTSPPNPTSFATEPACRITTPRIQEAFLSLECTLESETDLSKCGISSLVIGRVVCAAIDENYINGSEKKYGPKGFMFYLNALPDFASGNQGERKVASLQEMRKG